MCSIQGGVAEDFRDAWYQQKGLPKTEAKRRYISTLIETMHKYASTTPFVSKLQHFTSLPTTLILLGAVEMPES